MRAYRDRREVGWRNAKVQSKVRGRALRRMAAEHPEIFQPIYKQELEREHRSHEIQSQRSARYRADDEG